MSLVSKKKQLGFLTRLLDDTSAQQRYQIALDQIILAEKLGYDNAWIAQHHFDREEGGLPSPFVLLSAAGQVTNNITLGTAVITLSFENPLRVIEDATVLNLLHNQRLELGLGSGATDATFKGFGLQAANRRKIFGDNFTRFQEILRNKQQLYPAPDNLQPKTWLATFSEQGAAQAGAAGFGLMLSRTQPRAVGGETSLLAIQHRIIDSYLAALPAGTEPRIMVSRTVLVVDEHSEGQQWLDGFIKRFDEKYADPASQDYCALNEFATIKDAYYGTPQQVGRLLAEDSVLERATHIAFQSHTIEPDYRLSNRSLELLIDVVAKDLGWRDE
ncbi:LLM class flavin-dependent oxidoreductase [Tatumella sp. UBA2305]|uniref:LLM class flavin-dependent oxidoreductase n=1 Tax=Tatumella sp. UBA2305 TaxID=1947647 RepID=UPI0025F9C8F9|nr:LLM class flavin-dependent oxidoreductase [Tatumella sp. UBA2305]